SSCVVGCRGARALHSFPTRRSSDLALRSSLARTFASGGVAANDSTFAQVCKPVKAQAMKIAKENGWMVAQLAERNRNAENTLDRSEEHTSELQSRENLVCRLLLEKK